MERRDFTINAIARRLETGELRRSARRRGRPRARACCARTSPTSFREDPLRIVRGLRFVSQLDLEPDEADARADARVRRRGRLVSGERIGGGLAADGLGELSKLLLGARAGQGAPAGARHGRARRRSCRSSSRRSASTRAPLSLPARRAHLRGRPGRGRPRLRAAGAARGAAPRPRQAAVGWRGQMAARTSEAGARTRSHERRSRARGAPRPAALPDELATRPRSSR